MSWIMDFRTYIHTESRHLFVSNLYSNLFIWNCIVHPKSSVLNSTLACRKNKKMSWLGAGNKKRSYLFCRQCYGYFCCCQNLNWGSHWPKDLWNPYHHHIHRHCLILQLWKRCEWKCYLQRKSNILNQWKKMRIKKWQIKLSNYRSKVSKHQKYQNNYLT